MLGWLRLGSRRRWLVLLGVGALLSLLLPGNAAWAAEGDRIERYAIDYQVQTSGVVEVTEEITYAFGSYGRHGIDRYFVTRERYDDTQDAVYTIGNLRVSSPDRGVPTQFSRRTDEVDGGRGEELRIRIGDPEVELDTLEATYEISYTLTGAMRTFSGYDEFYWDAIGFDWSAPIDEVAITASVPGGAQELSCFFGEVGSKRTCEASIGSDERGEFRASNLAPNQGVTIGVKIASGLISDNRPQLEPDGSQLSGGERLALAGVGGAGAVSLIGAPIAGVLWWRRNGRDQRYAGLAPGTTPLPGQPAQVVMSDPDLPIPVAFSPPKIPVAEAGLLIDGQVDTRETAATIIDLAVRGALTVASEGEGDFRVTLVDPNRATAPHEMVLLTALFEGSPPGTTVDLSTPGSLQTAHQEMQTSVRNQVTQRGWFRSVPSATAAGGVGFGALALVFFAIFGLGAAALWILVPLLPVIITVVIIRAKLKRGQRTADGRAMTDQVEGFKTYLATAEADQLRFEEGEDIFSRYLPWAITFELADRWAKVCADLVRLGRLPDVTPYWYAGSYYNFMMFNPSFITNSLATAAAPPPVTSGASMGTGFGGGSSFGGGGFSGGGGGGGGGGSW